MQQNKSINMVKSCNISRHSSASSKGSGSEKKNNVVKRDSYVALQPQFDPEKGLAFVNAVKEVRIKTQPDEEGVVQQQKIQQQQKIMRQSSFNQKEQKSDLMKKSHFSRVRRADSQTIEYQ